MCGCGIRYLLSTTLMIASFSFAAKAEELDFLNVSMEQLTDMEVMSVSKRREKASEVASAIYVITGKDIQRSGATTIPDALRLAPGVNVAQAGSSQWAVGVRGFNDQFSNKLLVLVDGRTVYSPEFSGVWWDVQNLLMEDIDRIEIIRGPGATVWGANAVNGVINIITKHAKNTVGGQITAAAGNHERLNTSVRYGDTIGENGYIRGYATYHDRNELEQASGDIGANDDWYTRTAGFRTDWELSDDSALMVKGDLYNGRHDLLYNFPDITGAPGALTTVDDSQEVKGGNLLANWTHAISDTSDFHLQSYLDYTYRDIAIIELHHKTFDIDFQHNWQPHARHQLSWGLGYRYIDDDLNGTTTLSLVPDDFSRHIFSGFIQDKIALIEDELYLTLGSKFEHNEYTQFEYQPNARLAWLIGDNQTLWGAVSKAVRTPDRATDGVTNVLSTFNAGGATGAVVRFGSSTAESEELIAWEMGYRIQPEENLAIDIATFYNDYDDLFINVVGSPTVAPFGGFAAFPILPVFLQNVGSGHSYGGEVSVNWQPYERWELELDYSYIDITIDNNQNSTINSENKTPHHQIGLHSMVEMSHAVEFDQHLYYVSEFTPEGSSEIDAYLRLDLRLAWQVSDSLELSLIGQNLLRDGHEEFSPFLYNSANEVGRSVFGKAVWRF